MADLTAAQMADPWAYLMAASKAGLMVDLWADMWAALMAGPWADP